jgi:hypothetical protein
MITTKASSADAIHIYSLTVAYLHDAKIGKSDLTNTLYAKEMWGGVFHIWSHDPTKQKQSIFPVAVCSYKSATQIWKIELASGETLTLCDKGNVWDIIVDPCATLHMTIAVQTQTGP